MEDKVKTKTCTFTKCGEEFPATPEYFARNKNSKDGLQSYCKRCKSEARKVHYQANKERLRQQSRTYRQANKERVNERDRRYYRNNKEAILKYQKDYYLENKEEVKKKHAAYYDDHKDKLQERQTTRYRSPRGKYAKIKSAAKERNIFFDLSYELYESQLWGQPCHYCGVELEITGLDRMDSSGGYTHDNVVPSCKECNDKKNTKPYEEFLAETNNKNTIDIERQDGYAYVNQ